jgi:hypothetical protein
MSVPVVAAALWYHEGPWPAKPDDALQRLKAHHREESRLMLPSVRADTEGGNNIVQEVRGLMR